MPGGTLPGGTLPGGTAPPGTRPGGSCPWLAAAEAGRTGPWGRMVGGGEPNTPWVPGSKTPLGGTGASQPVVLISCSVQVGGGGSAFAQRSIR